MTTGCVCPQCGEGLTPDKTKPCQECRERDMTPVQRVISRAINGKPIRLSEITNREKGQ